METLILFVLRGEFGCNRIINRFIEQDLKFESFGNLGLKYTLVTTLPNPAYVFLATMGGPMKVTIILLSAAPNPLVGLPGDSG